MMKRMVVIIIHPIDNHHDEMDDLLVYRYIDDGMIASDVNNTQLGKNEDRTTRLICKTETSHWNNYTTLVIGKRQAYQKYFDMLRR